MSQQGDTVARYGGEEFVVLLPDTDEDRARAAIERMLACVRDTPCLIRDGSSAHITFSAGIAKLLPGSKVFNTAAALLDAADGRSEERPGGKEWASRCRLRWY